MSGQKCFIAVAALVMVALAGRASGQEICACDCYWSGDCPEAGQWCNYGNLGNEDSCWWRAPKPQGVPGAGCTGDYHDWGQCDGACSSSSGRAFANSIESRRSVFECIGIWTDAFDKTAMRGGGLIDQEWIDRARELKFIDELMPYRLWRSLLEINMLARGPAFFGFPEGPQWVPANVAVADLTSDPDSLLNGVLASNAFLAEISETGSGWQIVMEMRVDALDREFLAKMCRFEDEEYGDQDLLNCVYDKIYNIALIYRLTGTRSSTERGGLDTPCRGCMGDCVPDDRINIDDLLQVIGDWGSTSLPAGDLDLDGIVDLDDLLAIISGWGDCVEHSGVL